MVCNNGLLYHESGEVESRSKEINNLPIWYQKKKIETKIKENLKTPILWSGYQQRFDKTLMFQWTEVRNICSSFQIGLALRPRQITLPLIPWITPHSVKITITNFSRPRAIIHTKDIGFGKFQEAIENICELFDNCRTSL